MQTAQEFYGKHYDTAIDKTQLDKAFKYLDMALRAEAEDIAGSTKPAMAFNAAVKAENLGFGRVA